MPPEKIVELTREQLKDIKGLSFTLFTTSLELDKLVTRRHPDLEQSTYLIRHAISHMLKIMKKLGKEW